MILGSKTTLFGSTGVSSGSLILRLVAKGVFLAGIAFFLYMKGEVSGAVAVW
jgi:hypothetical protein